MSELTKAIIEKDQAASIKYQQTPDLLTFLKSEAV